MEPHLAKLGRVVRFQYPLLGSFADFAFLAERVVVEVDGKSHRTAKGRASDALRDAKMEKHGWTVLRVNNEIVLADAAGWVASVLKPKLEEIDGHAD